MASKRVATYRRLIIMFSFVKIIFRYLRGPWKNARDKLINKDASEKNKLNFAGDIRIIGKNVIDRSKKRSPSTKKAPAA
jgi:hypothetical protein